MIISTKHELTKDDIMDEGNEILMHDPVKSTKAVLGFEDFTSSLMQRMGSNKDISMIK